MTEKSLEMTSMPHRSGFFRSVASVATGAAASQALAVVALPFVTRLYTPKQFGVLALYAGIVGILAVVACLRFDNAISLPRSGRAALQVGAIATLLLVLLAIFVGIGGSAVAVAGMIPPDLDGLSGVSFAGLLAIGMLGSGLYQIGTNWSIRSKRFALIGKTRFKQTFFGTAVQLGMGYAGFGAIGLIVGQIASQFAGAGDLTKEFMAKLRERSADVLSGRRLLWALQRYKRFPIFDAPAALLNSVSAQIPAIIFATWFSPEQAGYFALSTRILSAPIGLVGVSISQVLMPKIIEANRSGSAAAVIQATLGFLASICLVPFSIFIALAPSVFPLAFGSSWAGVGSVAAWTAVWTCALFIYVPLSTYLICVEAQALNMRIQMGFFIFRVAALAAALWIGQGINPIIAFSVVSLICYVVALMILISHAGVKLRSALSRTFLDVFIASAIGVLVWASLKQGGGWVCLALSISCLVYLFRVRLAKSEFTRILT